MRTSNKQAGVSPGRLTVAGLAGAAAGMCSAPGWLSFPGSLKSLRSVRGRTEGRRLPGPDSELHVGQSRLSGPTKHDRGSGTCRIEVSWPAALLRMRLDIDPWPPTATALEQIRASG